MTIPRATYTGAGDVRLRFPYCRTLDDRLKTEIPPYARDYGPFDKTWTIATSYAALGVRLLMAMFPGARFERPDPRSVPEAMPGNHCALAVLHLLPSAPPELIEGAYRILARLHHPDVGGDGETMKRLNAARDALHKRVTA